MLMRNNVVNVFVMTAIIGHVILITHNTIDVLTVTNAVYVLVAVFVIVIWERIADVSPI